MLVIVIVLLCAVFSSSVEAAAESPKVTCESPFDADSLRSQSISPCVDVASMSRILAPVLLSDRRPAVWQSCALQAAFIALAATPIVKASAFMPFQITHGIFIELLDDLQDSDGSDARLALYAQFDALYTKLTLCLEHLFAVCGQKWPALSSACYSGASLVLLLDGYAATMKALREEWLRLAFERF